MDAVKVAAAGTFGVALVMCGSSIAHTRTDANPENDSLNQVLSLFVEAGRTFTRIFLYKSELQSGPCLGELFHHQGVILQVTVPGRERKFLRLDFGSDGLHYRVTDAFPEIEGHMDWDVGHSFREAVITQERSEPSILQDALAEIRGWRYAAMSTNCQSFATYIWGAFTDRPLEPDFDETGHGDGLPRVSTSARGVFSD